MKRTLLCLCLLVCVFAKAQNDQEQETDYGDFSGSLESNLKWYNDDSETGPFIDDAFPNSNEHVRSNNYLKLDYTYKKWAAGIQLESYAPLPLLSYSPKYDDTGVGTYYAEYRGEKLRVTAGYFYEQFGSGLILRSWEDRQLGINNSLRGGRVIYRPTGDLMFTALYGQQREGFEVSDGHVFGFDTEMDLANFLKWETFSLDLGLSYVGRYEETDIENPNFEELTNAFSGRLDFFKNRFYANAEYVYKTEDIVYDLNSLNNNFVKPGNALLLNFGYIDQGIGIDATIRRMENMGFFSERKAAGPENIYNMNIINYLPALTKQHDYLLTNIYVYQAQPYVSLFRPDLKQAGEIGGQFDIYYNLKKGSSLGGEYGTKLALNASYWANLDGEYDFAARDYEVDFFGFGQKYFSDVSLEVRKQLSPDWKTIFTYINQYYSKKYIEKKQGNIKAHIAVAEATHNFNDKQSIRVVGQHLWTEEDHGSWAGATVEFNVNHQLSFYVSDIYKYGVEENLSNSTDAVPETHYYTVGGSYTLGPHRFALSYGRQRGGVICVGGVCRYVPPSTGLSASINFVF